MENVFMLSNGLQPARTQQQQLKLVMKLPVRLVSEGKEMDILPLTSFERNEQVLIKRRLLLSPHDDNYMSLNQMISFFSSCLFDDLLCRNEVAMIYNVDYTTINRWAKRGILKRYTITANLTVYKRSELPSLETLFGPYEHE